MIGFVHKGQVEYITRMENYWKAAVRYMGLILAPIGMIALGFTAFVLIEKIDKWMEDEE